jgi:hypothetical protein
MDPDANHNIKEELTLPSIWRAFPGNKCGNPHRSFQGWRAPSPPRRWWSAPAPPSRTGRSAHTPPTGQSLP